jgi:hypothetical protein
LECLVKEGSSMERRWGALLRFGRGENIKFQTLVKFTKGLKKNLNLLSKMRHQFFNST